MTDFRAGARKEYHGLRISYTRNQESNQRMMGTCPQKPNKGILGRLGSTGIS